MAFIETDHTKHYFTVSGQIVGSQNKTKRNLKLFLIQHQILSVDTHILEAQSSFPCLNMLL